MEREKLIKKIYEYDKLCQKNKLRRMFLTVLFYTVVNMIISLAIYQNFNENISIKIFILFLIVSSLFAIISYWVNISIFSEIFNKSDKEDKILESMKKELIEFDKKHSIAEKFGVEDFLSNKHL